MESVRPSWRVVVGSETLLRWLSAANVFVLLAILGTGATVRLTASGLGCRHWPGCQPGEPFPQKGFHSYIEFGNRIVAGTVVIVTLVAWIVALIAPSASKRVRRLALVTFLGTFAQAPLGAITVYYDLNPWLVLVHFLLSIVIVTTAVLMFLEVWRVRTEAVPLNLYRLAQFVGAAAVVMLVTGTFATARGRIPGATTRWQSRGSATSSVRCTSTSGRRPCSPSHSPGSRSGCCAAAGGSPASRSWFSACSCSR